MSDLNNYYTKGRTSGSLWNFDLNPLMDNFSFYDFCDALSGNLDTGKEHGGIFVLTDKQYIVSYTAGFGDGSHVYTEARCMKELLGGGEIANQQEGILLSTQLNMKYITGRIIYEPYLENGEIKHAGFIVFSMCRKQVTNQQYEQFLKFYEQYNDELIYVCKKFDFTVNYTYYDENGKVARNSSNSLDNLKNYMQKHLILSNESDNSNEVILNKGKVK